ncbi:MAG: ZIP family metal transporter [Bacilli bacterium]
MIAIIVHNIPEGIATFLSSSANLTLGVSLTIAIALHNIPEGISISVPVFKATGSRKKP